MRFKILLFLFSASYFFIAKPMNFGLPHQGDIGDDDDLTYFQKTKGYVKKHPILSFVYFSVLAGIVTGGVFSYKQNPQEFWNAVAGLKEASKDLVDDVRGRPRRSEQSEVDYQSNSSKNNNQTVSSQNPDAQNFTADDVRKNKEIMKELREEVIKDPETMKKLTSKLVEQIDQATHIPKMSKDINDACLEIYNAKEWNKIELTLRGKLTTAVENARKLNQVTNNPMFEKVIESGENTLVLLNDLIYKNDKNCSLLQEKMENSDIVHWKETELKASHTFTSDDLLYRVGGKKREIKSEIYDNWRHVNKRSDWAKIGSGSVLGAVLMAFIWYKNK